MKIIGKITPKNRYGYKIVLPILADKCLQYAAEELKNYIFAVCGARLNVKSYARFEEYALFLGCGKPSDKNIVNYDGFVISNKNTSLFIDGYRSAGVLNGVYAFCEKVLHIGFFTPDSTFIPKKRTISIPELNITEAPSFSIREFSCEVVDENPQFSACRKLRSTCFDYGDEFGESGAREYANPPVNVSGKCQNGEPSIYRKMGNDWRFGTGHTINSFLPNDEETLRLHPDWFADEKGIAICMMNALTDDGDIDESKTNGNLFALVKKAEQFIDGKPSARMLMIGHNDTDVMCNCSRCRAAREKFGGFAGVQMLFLNAVARLLADFRKSRGYKGEFYVCGFAYWPSWKAPAFPDGNGFKPAHEKVIARDDVCIKLAHMTCMHHGLFRNCALNRDSGFYIENIRAWQAVCKHFAIWEYNNNFSHFLWWLNSFDIIKEQYALYKELNALHVLSQGGVDTYANALKLYVYSKSMWDYTSDPQKAIAEFNKGVFGKYRATADNFVKAMNENKRRLDKTLPNGFCSAIYEGDISGFFAAENYPKELLFGQISSIKNVIKEIEASEETSAKKERLIKEFTSMLIIPEYMVFKNYEKYFSDGKRAFAEEFLQHLKRAGIRAFHEGAYGEIEKVLLG